MTREMFRRRGETERQRWDRNFADLLQELRVAQTGVLSTWIAVVLAVVAAAWFLSFWAIIPVFRHNWIDEDDVEEDLEADADRDDHAAAVRDL